MENYKFDKNGLELKGTNITIDDVASPTFAGIRQTIGCIWQESKHYEVDMDKITLHIKSEALQYHFFVNYPLSKANRLPASSTSQPTISTGVNSGSPCPTQ